jgi:hypothetical protein
VRVTILRDPGNADGTIGGAELTLHEFAAAAPDGVEFTDLDDADAVIVGNCVTYPESLKGRLSGKRVTRYFNDLDPHSPRALRSWFLRHAECIFTSPLHAERFDAPPKRYHLIPPPLDVDRFRPPANAKRQGTVSIGTWQSPSKGAQMVERWAAGNGTVTVYGTGIYYPGGRDIDYRGPIPYVDIPETLWQYERFIHLPMVTEPFGRAVAEAHIAGCKVITNRNVGATYWLDKVEQIESAAEDFWKVALG